MILGSCPTTPSLTGYFALMRRGSQREYSSKPLKFIFKVAPGWFRFLGNRDVAITVIREAKSHVPNERSVHFNLANMLGQKDEFVVRVSLQNYTTIRQRRR